MNKEKLFEEISRLTEARELRSGVFWVISDNYDLSGYTLLMFDIPCDPNGQPSNTHTIELNSKSGTTYNHKKLWEEEIKNNNEHRLYNKKSYDYYPRGRVQVSHNRADIYLNQHINQPTIIEEIKEKFGLYTHNISKVRVIVDGSVHYRCFLDRD